MNQRHREALAAVEAAASELTEAHWRADAMVHVAQVDVATAARRLDVARPVILEMLAAIRTVRELGADADLHRDKFSIAGITGNHGTGQGGRADMTAKKAMTAIQPGDRERIAGVATAGMKPKAIAARLGLEAKAVAAELRRARAAEVPIPRFPAGRDTAANTDIKETRA